LDLTDLDITNCRLTDEQQTVLTFVERGHNILITGQAGTGKSFLVNEIVKQLRLHNKSVAVICSSGLSCTVYDNTAGLNASTVHSFYGLQTADLPNNCVIEREFYIMSFPCSVFTF